MFSEKGKTMNHRKSLAAEYYYYYYRRPVAVLL